MATKKPKETYTRNAVITNVHDGDTVSLDLDLGYEIHAHVNCRMNGIDAPELSTADGKVSAAYLQKRLPLGTAVTVQTVKGDENDKYGRYLAEVFVEGQTKSVNQEMIDQGLAKPYDGGPRT